METLFNRVFRPAPTISLSAWADKHAVVPSTSAEPGRWRTSRTPYLREPMDAISDPTVQEMVVMKPAQVGATVGLIGNAITYWIDVDPAPVMIVHPTQAEGEKWSKEKLQPILDDTERVQDKVATRARDGDNTIRNKKFDGGWLGIIGAESPRELRSRSAPRIIFDERDAYKRSSGEEGDPAALAAKRTLTFPNAFILTISTPLEKGESPTEELFNRSDQRRYFVRCPHCQEEQVLEWGDQNTAFGVKWERELVGEKVVHKPETAAYLCRHCRTLIEEHHKPQMVMTGRWIAQNPGAKIRGYHFNALISLFPGASWSAIVEEFLAARADPNKLKVWVNTVLAETWEERSEKVDTDSLADRTQLWRDSEGKRIEVPGGVGVLTAFVDVQKDRVEMLVVGWGKEEVSWMVAHHRIYGDVQVDPTVWQRVDALRQREWRFESGARRRIMAMGVDAGDGQRVNEVYDYVRPRQGEGVWATKGQPARQAEPIRILKKRDRHGIQRVDIGTHPMKITLFSRLALQLLPGKSTPKGYMHLLGPDPEWHNGGDREFYEQFGREKQIPKLVKGRLVHEFRATGRNEAIDLWVGNLAMLHVLGPAVRDSLGAWAEEIEVEGERMQAGGEADEEATGSAEEEVEMVPRRRGGSSWATNW